MFPRTVIQNVDSKERRSNSGGVDGAERDDSGGVRGDRITTLSPDGEN